MIYPYFLTMWEESICTIFLRLFKNAAKLKQQTVLTKQLYTAKIQKELFVNEHKTQFFVMKKVMP